jgi:hypothetical protein
MAALFSEPLPLIEARSWPDLAMVEFTGTPLLRATPNSLPAPLGVAGVAVMSFCAIKWPQ